MCLSPSSVTGTVVSVSYLMADKSKDKTMQESWVDVQKQEGGTLTHTSSKEELQQLLASAASEEELSDTDQQQLYQVTFHPTEDTEEEGEEAIAQVPSIKPTSSHIRSKLPSVGSFRVVDSRVDSRSRSFGDGICSLSLLVPVIILTHLAMFGIGYYLGRRWSSDAGSAAMRIFHV